MALILELSHANRAKLSSEGMPSKTRNSHVTLRTIVKLISLQESFALLAVFGNVLRLICEKNGFSVSGYA